MNAAICRLACILECLPAASSLEDLFDVVKGQKVTVDDVQAFVKFDPAKYHREPMITAENFQVLVLAWLPGQKSPIHNHRGSQCCVRVLQGTAVETVYAIDSYGNFETHVDHYRTGLVLAGEDADIHTVENLPDSGIDLVTMHVYRPALTNMELFDAVDGKLFKRLAAAARR